MGLWLGSLSKELLPLLVVQPLPVHQFLVSSLLLNATLADNHDLICPLDGLQPVSDYQKGLPGTPGQGLLNLCGVGDVRNLGYLLNYLHLVFWNRQLCDADYKCTLFSL